MLGPGVGARSPTLDVGPPSQELSAEGTPGPGLLHADRLPPSGTQPSSRLFCTELDFTGLTEAKAHGASPPRSVLT